MYIYHICCIIETAICPTIAAPCPWGVGTLGDFPRLVSVPDCRGPTPGALQFSFGRTTI